MKGLVSLAPPVRRFTLLNRYTSPSSYIVTLVDDVWLLQPERVERW